MKKIILLFAICVMSISMFAQKNKLLTPNMEKAIEAYQNRDYQNTVELCEKEIETNPNNGLAYTYKASVYLDTFTNSDNNEKAKECEENLDKAICLLKKYPKELCFAHLEKTRYYYFVKNDAYNCELEFQKAIETKYNLPETYWQYADFLNSEKRIDEAISYLKKMLEIEPNNTTAINRIVACYFQTKDLDKTFEYAQNSIKIDKEQFYPYWYTAYCYFQKEDYKNCLNEIVNYISNVEKTGEEKDLKYAVEFFDAIYQENIIFFFKEIEKLKEENQNLWSLPYCIGQMMMSYITETAYFYFEQAYNINPETPDINYFMAYCLNEMNQNQKALEHIEKAENLLSHPVDINMWYDISYLKISILRDMKKYDESISMSDSIHTLLNAEMIKSFLKRDNMNYVAKLLDYMKYIKYSEGYTYEYKRDFEKALECFKYTEDNYQYGRMLYKLGRKEETKDTISKVIQTLNPLKDYSEIAYCKIFLEDFDGAEQYIENQILSQEGLDAGNYYDIACMYSLMNKKEKANKYLKVSMEQGYYTKIYHVERDPDMDNIRDTKEYNEILKEYKKE